MAFSFKNSQAHLLYISVSRLATMIMREMLLQDAMPSPNGAA
jgi:hypothetical protein